VQYWRTVGYYHLEGMVPVDWFEVPCGSPEMAKIIPERLAHHPVTMVQAHGAFSKGRTLKEPFFRLCVANNSGYVVRLATSIDIDVGELRTKIQADADSPLSFPLTEYVIEGDEARDFPDDDEMVKEFIKPKLCTKPHWQVSQPLDPSSEAIFSHKSDFGRSGRGVGGLFYRANGKAKPYLSKRDRPLPCSPGYCQCHLE